jgi:glycosyltransferase involved in cell wall biosynthesis
MNSNICIIIPTYNEALRLPISVYNNFLDANQSVFLLFVNDGSNDKTLDLLSTNFSQKANSKVLNLATNIGKANAVREGMLYALKNIDAQYYGYLDADLSTPLEEMVFLKNEIESNPDLIMVFGSRILKIGSEIKRKTYRHVIGRIIATLISTQLGLAIYDTQCGAKLFKASIISTLFENPFMSKWLFDVEIFNRLLQQFTMQEVSLKIKEVPLNKWIDVDGSKLGMKELFTIPIDLLKITWIYKK